MSKPPRECSPHGWTLDTLESHLSSRITAFETHIAEMTKEREERDRERISAMKENIKLALDSGEKAISKAETANDKRFDSVNEFRKTLSDQTVGFLPRTEYTIQNATLTEANATLERRVSQIESRGAGRKEGISSVGIIALGTLTGIASIASILAVILAVSPLQRSSATELVYPAPVQPTATATPHP